MRRVPPDPPHQHVVAAGGVERGRVQAVRRVVDHGQAGGAGEQLAALLRRQRVARLHVRRHGVAREHRHARAGGGHADVLLAEDLARLAHALALLGRVVVAVLEGLDLRQHVEGDLVRIDGGRGHLLRVELRLHLLVQLLDGALSGAGHRLIARHHDPLDAGVPEDRPERHDGLHRRAVRVRHDALVAVERVRVHLGHDEWHVLVHAPLGRVVDHDGARVGEARRPLLAHLRPRREQRDVEALDRLVVERLDRQRAASPLERAPGRALRGERHHLVRRERALVQHLEHGRAHRAGGSHDGDPHRPTPPSGGALPPRPRAAPRRRRARTPCAAGARRRPRAPRARRTRS